MSETNEAANKEKLTLTEEHLSAHSGLGEMGLEVGDEIEFPSNGATDESLAKALEDGTVEKVEATDIHNADAPKDAGASEDAGSTGTEGGSEEKAE